MHTERHAAARRGGFVPGIGAEGLVTGLMDSAPGDAGPTPLATDDSTSSMLRRVMADAMYEALRRAQVSADDVGGMEAASGGGGGAYGGHSAAPSIRYGRQHTSHSGSGPVAPFKLSGNQAAQLSDGIKLASQHLGIEPKDLATAISYETAGTMDPWKAGPHTKWGQHRGLIQWGEPQARQYGVSASSTIGEQMAAVERYLRDAGVRPGMGLKDVYSAINAGHVGKYGASDRPGMTVASHVAEMERTAHRDALSRLDATAKGGLSPAEREQEGRAATVPTGPDGIQGHVRGTLKLGDESFPYGSGGVRGSAHVPYGDYPINPDAPGAWGRAHNAMAVNNDGSIWDASLGRMRTGIEMHIGHSANLITEGCLAFLKDDYPRLKARVREMVAKTGHAYLHVGPNGASITPEAQREAERAVLPKQAPPTAGAVTPGMPAAALPAVNLNVAGLDELREAHGHVDALHRKIAGLSGVNLKVHHEGFGHRGDHAPGAVRTALNGNFGSDGRRFG